ncbi:hypothetical protein AVEN_9995-1 [Araneus ventricosus]|uniref:MATH domain-containing protein n=1 Tax=Araneus ventricosus TaxID=182803 RepID=A0A4Y2LCZ4_ARAVE|nr:hypothetical protein AVEN_9995-1 [Araneus ventricosus]
MASDQAISPFTFTWMTINFYKESVVSLDSPVFIADSIHNTKWSLSLCVEGWQSSTPGYITCDLQRENDESGLDNIYIDFQISILDGKGVALNTVREEGCLFVMHFLALAADAPYRVSKNLIQIKPLWKILTNMYRVIHSPFGVECGNLIASFQEPIYALLAQY